MKVVFDKIGSVTKNCHIGQEAEVMAQIRAEEGMVLAVEVLTDKRVYDKIELPTGRIAKIKKGDVLAVALGARRALKGYYGSVPCDLKAGDVIQLLNLGGVAGVVESENIHEVGPAFDIRVIGALKDADGAPLSIKTHRLYPPQDEMTGRTPLVIISGTSMDSGKTTVASEVIKHASRGGLTVHAAKLAGVAALKDTKNMSDYGARRTTSFVDAGHPSTVGSVISLRCAKGAINYLSEGAPDFIIIEFGDGIWGKYGVEAVLSDPEIRETTLFHIGCAYDPVGAKGLTDFGRAIGNPYDVISGPVTDNRLGSDFIEENCGVIGLNAFNEPEKFLPLIQAALAKAGKGE